MITKKTVFAFEKFTRVKLTLNRVCHYQLTVVANWLLLTGNQFVATFSMLGPKPIAIVVNHNGSYTSLTPDDTFAVQQCKYAFVWNI